MNSPLPRLRHGCLALLVSGVILALPAGASVIVTEHNWDSGPHPWYTQYDSADLTTSPAGGNPDGWLTVTFPETGLPEIDEVGWSEIVTVNASDFFAGNWNSGFTVSFDFYAANALPQDLQLQFGSTNGNVWGYNVTDQITQTQTWTTITVSLGYSAGWGPLPLFSDTEEQFLADLSSIDWIGIYIFRDESTEEVYGIDNFRLLVPEPAEWALLAAVLAGARWRRRRGEANALTPAGPGAAAHPPRDPPTPS